MGKLEAATGLCQAWRLCPHWAAEGLRGTRSLPCPFTRSRSATTDIFKPLAYDLEGISGNFKVTSKEAALNCNWLCLTNTWVP